MAALRPGERKCWRATCPECFKSIVVDVRPKSCTCSECIGTLQCRLLNNEPFRSKPSLLAPCSAASERERSRSPRRGATTQDDLPPEPVSASAQTSSDSGVMQGLVQRRGFFSTEKQSRIFTEERQYDDDDTFLEPTIIMGEDSQLPEWGEAVVPLFASSQGSFFRTAHAVGAQARRR